jgi:hypothetical protein
VFLLARPTRLANTGRETAHLVVEADLALERRVAVVAPFGALPRERIVALTAFIATIDWGTMSRASVGCILRAPGGPVNLERYALRIGARVE